MWKNVFIEACILSVLVFGGFYINANYLKDKMENPDNKANTHISGFAQPQSTQKQAWQHVSGGGSPTPTAQPENPTPEEKPPAKDSMLGSPDSD